MITFIERKMKFNNNLGYERVNSYREEKHSHNMASPTIQEVMAIFKEFLRKNIIETVLAVGRYIVLLFNSETTSQIKFYLISVLVFYFSSGFLLSINKSLQRRNKR